MNQMRNSKFENSEKHRALIAMMQEFGILQGNLSYNEAVEKYYNWCKAGIRKPEEKLFGEYSFRVTEYEILTNKELEIMGDVFRLYKPKKLFSGVKMYCKAFGGADIGIGRGTILKPGDLLWEVSGLDIMTVRQMAQHVSDVLGINVIVFDRNNVTVSQ